MNGEALICTKISIVEDVRVYPMISEPARSPSTIQKRIGSNETTTPIGVP